MSQINTITKKMNQKEECANSPHLENNSFLLCKTINKHFLKASVPPSCSSHQWYLSVTEIAKPSTIPRVRLLMLEIAEVTKIHRDSLTKSHKLNSSTRRSSVDDLLGFLFEVTRRVCVIICSPGRVDGNLNIMSLIDWSIDSGCLLTVALHKEDVWSWNRIYTVLVVTKAVSPSSVAGSGSLCSLIALKTESTPTSSARSVSPPSVAFWHFGGPQQLANPSSRFEVLSVPWLYGWAQAEGANVADVDKWLSRGGCIFWRGSGADSISSAIK